MRRQGHKALRLGDGQLTTFDPHPERTIMLSDADRGIITIVYKCSECGDTDTERLFSDKPIPAALCCPKCRAGFGVANQVWGTSNHPGMWPDGLTQAN